jgi:hypothetical protein
MSSRLARQASPKKVQQQQRQQSSLAPTAQPKDLSMKKPNSEQLL